jgi:hypothetical protein
LTRSYLTETVANSAVREKSLWLPHGKRTPSFRSAQAIPISFRPPRLFPTHFPTLPKPKAGYIPSKSFAALHFRASFAQSHSIKKIFQFFYFKGGGKKWLVSVIFNFFSLLFKHLF